MARWKDDTVSGDTLLARCKCGIKVKAPRSLAGKFAKCPKCGDAIAIPRINESDLDLVDLANNEPPPFKPPVEAATSASAVSDKGTSAERKWLPFALIAVAFALGLTTGVLVGQTPDTSESAVPEASPGATKPDVEKPDSNSSEDRQIRLSDVDLDTLRANQWRNILKTDRELFLACFLARHYTKPAIVEVQFSARDYDKTLCEEAPSDVDFLGYLAALVVLVEAEHPELTRYK